MVRSPRLAVVGVALALPVACTGERVRPPVGSGPTTSTSPSGTPSSPAVVFDASKVRLRLVPFARGLDNPLFLTHAGDGSGEVFVVEQPGRIRAVDPGGEIHTFLDIRARVAAGGERGLLGLAFHPNYPDNGRLFVDYTDRRGDTVVSEFRRATESAADQRSERVLLHIDQPYANHNGGMLAFGPDGFLYIGTGDGGSGGDPMNNGQRLDTLLGKILRVDVDSGSPYGIPPDNPFVERDGARREIWAYGLRNPWRFSFDRSTGDLFVGDVGQNAFEEIDARPATSTGGENYGWRIVEGFSCYRARTCDRRGLTAPVAQYPTPQGCAVTGGYVYRGTAQRPLAGGYLFGDFCNGRIFAFGAADALRGPVRHRMLLDTDLSISSFGEDEDGELYLIDLGGRVLRLAA